MMLSRTLHRPKKHVFLSELRTGCSVVDNALDYQSRGRTFDILLLPSFRGELFEVPSPYDVCVCGTLSPSSHYSLFRTGRGCMCIRQLKIPRRCLCFEIHMCCFLFKSHVFQKFFILVGSDCLSGHFLYI